VPEDQSLAVRHDLPASHALQVGLSRETTERPRIVPAGAVSEPNPRISIEALDDGVDIHRRIAVGDIAVMWFAVARPLRVFVRAKRGRRGCMFLSCRQLFPFVVGGWLTCVRTYRST